MNVLHRLSSNPRPYNDLQYTDERPGHVRECPVDVVRGRTDSYCTGFEELRGPIAHLEIPPPSCPSRFWRGIKTNAMHQSSNGNQAKRSSEVRAQSDLCSGGVELNLQAGSLQTGTRILVMAKF